MPFNFFQKFAFKKGAPQKTKYAPEDSKAQKTPDARIQQDSPKKILQSERHLKSDEEPRFIGKSIIAGDLKLVPHISEKSSGEKQKHSRVYAFRAAPNATKHLLKKAVEDSYDVKVSSVRIINVIGKIRRRRNIIGKTSGYKKAIVALKNGYEIAEW